MKRHRQKLEGKVVKMFEINVKGMKQSNVIKSVDIMVYAREIEIQN